MHSLVAERSDAKSATKQQLEHSYALYDRGEYLNAYISYKRLFEQFHPTSELWEGLGASAWGLGLFSEALHSFQQACVLDPLNPSHWSNIGLAYRDLKEPQRAINAFKAALLVKSDFAGAYNEWANVLIDLNQPHQAQAHYHTALSLCDNRAVYHHNYGVCKKQLGERESAKQCFLTALSLDANYHHSLEELGLLLLEEGDSSGAEYLHQAATDRAQWILCNVSPSAQPNAQNILRISGLLIPSQCMDVRNAIQSADQVRGKTSANEDEQLGNVVDIERRDVSIAAVDSATASTITELLHTLQPSLEAHFGLSLNGFESPQFLRYLPGQFYSAHKDSHCQQQPKRRVSVVIFLSNQRSVIRDSLDIAGGGLFLYQNGMGKLVSEALGNAVAFPSSMLHEVKPISDGIRYTITAWYF